MLYLLAGQTNNIVVTFTERAKDPAALYYVLELRHIATNDVFTYSWLKSANLSQYTARYDKFALILDADFPTGQYRYTAFESTTTNKSGSVGVVENGLAAVKFDPQDYETWDNTIGYVEFGGTTPAAPSAVAPIIEPVAGTYAGFVQLTMTITTPDNRIYYTTDGSIPTSQNGTLYDPLNKPVVTSSATIRARTYADGLSFSSVTSSAFVIIAITVEAIPAGGETLIGTLDPIVLISNDEDATIYYTVDGSEPTESSAEFTAPIPAFEVITTLKARAFNSPAAPSAILTELYNIRALPPVVSTNSGIFISEVTPIVTNPNPQGTIQQSVDGGAWETYTGETFDVSVDVDYRIFADGVYVASDTVSRAYVVQVATPVISPDGAIFQDTQQVTVTTSTAGATIRYRLDGVTPTESDPLYDNNNKPVLNASANFIVKGFKTGCLASDTNSATFVKIEGFYLAANNLRAYLSQNRGGTWAELQPYGNVDKSYTTAGTGVGNTPIVLGSTIDAIRVSNDDGASWFTPTFPNANTAGLPNNTLNFDGNDAVIITARTLALNNVFLSTDGLVSFESIIVNGNTNGANFSGIYKKGLKILVTAENVNSSAGFLSLDGGSTWSLINTGSRVLGFAPYISDDGNRLFMTFRRATGADPALYISIDGGVTPIIKTTPITANYAACSDDLQYILISQANGTPQRSIDGGDSFLAVSGIAGQTRQIRCDKSGRYWMVLTTTRAYLSTNFGASFTETQPIGNVNSSWQSGFILP